MTHRRTITDEEIRNAKMPHETQLIVSENGTERELTLDQLLNEKADQFNTTDYLMLCASLQHYGAYHAGSHYGWKARVK